MGRPADTDSTGSNTTRSLQTKGGACKGGGIDRGHPDSGLVDLEQICYQGVEIDVRISEIIEGQLLPVPNTLLVDALREKEMRGGSHLKFSIKDLHVKTVLLDLLHTNSLCFCLVTLLVAKGLNLMVLS